MADVLMPLARIAALIFVIFASWVCTIADLETPRRRRWAVGVVTAGLCVSAGFAHSLVGHFTGARPGANGWESLRWVLWYGPLTAMALISGLVALVRVLIGGRKRGV